MYLWIQLKFKGCLVHYQNKLLYLKVKVSPSVEPVTGGIAKSGLECVQCKFVFYKKCQKTP